MEGNVCGDKSKNKCTIYNYRIAATISLFEQGYLVFHKGDHFCMKVGSYTLWPRRRRVEGEKWGIYIVLPWKCCWTDTFHVYICFVLHVCVCMCFIRMYTAQIDTCSYRKERVVTGARGQDWIKCIAIVIHTSLYMHTQSWSQACIHTQGNNNSLIYYMKEPGYRIRKWNY